MIFVLGFLSFLLVWWKSNLLGTQENVPDNCLPTSSSKLITLQTINLHGQQGSPGLTHGPVLGESGHDILHFGQNCTWICFPPSWIWKILFFTRILFSNRTSKPDVVYRSLPLGFWKKWTGRESGEGCKRVRFMSGCEGGAKHSFFPKTACPYRLSTSSFSGGPDIVGKHVPSARRLLSAAMLEHWPQVCIVKITFELLLTNWFVTRPTYTAYLTRHYMEKRELC